MKKLIFVMCCMILAGCTSGHPVPELAIKQCMQAGGIPKYRSTSAETTFYCVTKVKKCD